MVFVTVSLSTSIVLLAFFGWKWYQYCKAFQKIPGPAGVPIFGYLLELWCPPEEMWKHFRKLSVAYYPIYKFWQMHRPSVHIMSPDDIEMLLSSTKHTAKSNLYDLLHPWLNFGLLTSDGNRWQSRRKILTGAFHFHILREFFGVFLEESEVLVEKLKKECSKSSTDIDPILTQSTLNIICETAMGTKLEETKECREYTKAVYEIGELTLERLVCPWYFPELTFWFSRLYQKQRRLLQTLHSFTKSVIEKRRIYLEESNLLQENQTKKKRLAMLDLLFAAQKEGQPIDDDGIREEVDTFMFEGHDTTRACMTFTLMLLACHKDIQEKVVGELKEVLGDLSRTPTLEDLNNLRYLEQVLKESLRLYPSVPLIGRLTDDEIRTPSGYTIPPNTNVLVHIYDLHRNPDLYPDPDKFDSERFSPENTQGRHPFAYIPFSAGPRNCIGQKFAMLEIKTAISAILRKFVLEPIDTPETITMLAHLVAKTKNGVRIKLSLR